MEALSGGLFHRARSLGAAEPAREFLHASRGIDKLLATRKERMAAGANFEPDAGLGGARLEGVSARADHRALNVFWMNAWFHREEL